ncbi:MAG: ABC transporter ATP-binding protein, partial [Alistipes sp.]|nr:ABC transporter ATP-binding protein [Alistipes sp.]
MKMSIRGYIKWLWLAAEGLRGRIFLQAAVGVVHVAVSLMYVWTCKQLIDIATSRIEGNIYLFIVAMVGCIITQILLST